MIHLQEVVHRVLVDTISIATVIAGADIVSALLRRTRLTNVLTIRIIGGLFHPLIKLVERSCSIQLLQVLEIQCTMVADIVVALMHR